MGKKSKKGSSVKTLSLIVIVVSIVLSGFIVLELQKKQNSRAKAEFTPIWSGDMEEGNMNDWWYPDTKEGNNGGGEYNNADSGNSDSVASTEQVHSGSWAVKSKLTNGSGGTRLFRWLEPRANRQAYYSAWVYLPQNYTLTGNPTNGKYFNIFQFKSRSTAGRNDPLWAFYANNGADGKLYLRPGWGWGQAPLAGPTSTDGIEGKWYQQSSIPLPVGQWVHLEAFLSQSKDFDGQLMFWQDGQLIFDMNNIRTSYNNCNFNTWCASNEWAVNLYSDGLSPIPAVMYIDDAIISSTRVSGPSLTPTPTLVPTSTPAPTAGPTPTPTIIPTGSTSPSVTIVSPSNGAVVARGRDTVITTNVSAGITKVVFSVNNDIKCTDTTAFYTCTWHLPSKRNINYTIKAKAYDGSNNSAEASITVRSTN